MGEFLALLTALLFSVGVIFYKKSVVHASPFSVNLFKNSVALALLAITTIILGQTQLRSIPARDLLIIFASGVIGIGISDTLFLMTLERLGASRTALVDCLYSPFVILFSFMLYGETLSLLAGLGGLLIIGSVAVSSQQSFGGVMTRNHFWAGCAFGATAMATVAIAIVMVKPILHAYPLCLISTIRMAGGLSVLIFALPFHADRHSVLSVFRPQPAWKWLLPGTFFGSYLSIITWLAGFKYSQSGVAALLNQTSTVLIVVFAAIFLKERMTRHKLLALGMAFTGALIILY